MKTRDTKTMDELDDLLDEIQPDDALYMFHMKRGIAKREIYITDEIGENFFYTVILPFKQMQEEDPTKPIHIYINCVGGSITEGFVLCDLIDKTTCPVTVEIMGYAYSMACYIAMAGRNNPNVKKICHRFSFGLIHAGSVGFSGDANKAKQIQAFYNKIDKLTKEYLLAHTCIDDKLYKKNYELEWYLTADEMLKYGIVDEIVEADLMPPVVEETKKTK